MLVFLELFSLTLRFLMLRFGFLLTLLLLRRWLLLILVFLELFSLTFRFLMLRLGFLLTLLLLRRWLLLILVFLVRSMEFLVVESCQLVSFLFLHLFFLGRILHPIVSRADLATGYLTTFTISKRTLGRFLIVLAVCAYDLIYPRFVDFTWSFRSFRNPLPHC